MIFYFKTNGHLVYNSQKELRQGSNGENTVYVVAPFSFSSQVSASIILPNGKKIINQYLQRRKDLSAEYFSIDEVGLNVWSFDIPYSITQLYGTILVQFAFTSSNETVTTESVSIAIRRGVVSDEEIQIGDSIILEDIKRYIAIAQQNVDSCKGKLDIDESETTNKQAYVKRANGVQAMVDIDEREAGSIVQRQIDGNIIAGEPTGSYDATPKYYVDNCVAEIKSTHFDKDEVETKLSKYYNKNDIDSKLSYRYTKSQVDSKLSDYYTQNEVDSKLANYSTKSQLDSYLKKQEIETKLVDFITDEQLTKRLYGFVSLPELNIKLGKYYQKTVADRTFYNKEEVDEKLVEKANVSDLEQKANVSDLEQKQDKLQAGENISLENNIVSVVPDELELIEKRIIGYSITTKIPNDWNENYASYYKNVGTAKEPIYEALAEFESWETGKYYYFNSAGQTGRQVFTREVNGEPFSFKKIMVTYEIKPDTSENMPYFQPYYNNREDYAHIAVGGTSTSKVTNFTAYSYIDGIVEIREMTQNIKETGGGTKLVQTVGELSKNSKITGVRVGFINLPAIPANSVIKVYAVR